MPSPTFPRRCWRPPEPWSSASTMALPPRGFDDLRPAHGFAFTRLARGRRHHRRAGRAPRRDAAGRQRRLVDELARQGLRRAPAPPRDALGPPLCSPSKGWACTRRPTRLPPTPCSHGRPPWSGAASAPSATTCPASPHPAPYAPPGNRWRRSRPGTAPRYTVWPAGGTGQVASRANLGAFRGGCGYRPGTGCLRLARQTGCGLDEAEELPARPMTRRAFLGAAGAGAVAGLGAAPRRR